MNNFYKIIRKTLVILSFIALGAVLLIVAGTQIKPYTSIKFGLSLPQEGKIGTTTAITKRKLPNSMNLDIAFQSQAPFGNWNPPYKEACEEAALILAHYYYEEKPVNPKTMQKEILSLVDWENKVFGYHRDTNSFEMARTWREYFGHKNAEFKSNFTLEDLKTALAGGYPVIIPVAGRLLNNPHFKKPGPVYHALLAKGYLGNKIITHDVGTRLGKDFTYSAEILLNAAHDLDKRNILNGKKIMIILKS